MLPAQGGHQFVIIRMAAALEKKKKEKEKVFQSLPAIPLTAQAPLPLNCQFSNAEQLLRLHSSFFIPCCNKKQPLHTKADVSSAQGAPVADKI